MKPEVENESELRSYLLGELSQAERLQIEERLFLEGDSFQLLRSVEDDVIDEYLYDEIPPNERERFEQHFLSDQGRYKDIRIAKALKRYISTNAPVDVSTLEEEVREAAQPVKSKRSFFDFLGGRPLAKLAFAVTVLAIVLGGTWIALNLMRQPPQSRTAQTQLPDKGQSNEQPSDRQVNGEQANDDRQLTKDFPEEPKQPGLQSEQNQPVKRTEKQEAQYTEKSAGNRNNGASPPPSSAIYVASLMPGSGTREDGSSTQFKVPANVGSVDLQLPLITESSYRSYQATLFTDDDKTIRTWSGLMSIPTESGKVISLRVPAKLLKPQPYHVMLGGIQNDGSARDISSYSFQILK